MAPSTRQSAAVPARETVSPAKRAGDGSVTDRPTKMPKLPNDKTKADGQIDPQNAQIEGTDEKHQSTGGGDHGGGGENSTASTGTKDGAGPVGNATETNTESGGVVAVEQGADKGKGRAVESNGRNADNVVKESGQQTPREERREVTDATNTAAATENGAGSSGSGAVEAVTATPEIYLNDFDYIPSVVLKRLQKIAAYSYPPGQRYRLCDTDITQVGWGGFRSQWLCWQGRPLRVLFLARVRRKRMYDDYENVALTSARICFKFLREEDWAMAKQLIRGMSDPTSDSNKKTFQASRSTVVYVNGKAAGTETFAEIYDGTKTMGTKVTMAVIPQANLHPNDVVLVEARIQRYGPTQNTWAKGWIATFFLDCITRLYAAPEDAVDEAESAMEDDRVPTDDELDL